MAVICLDVRRRAVARHNYVAWPSPLSAFSGLATHLVVFIGCKCFCEKQIHSPDNGTSAVFEKCKSFWLFGEVSNDIWPLNQRLLVTGRVDNTDYRPILTREQGLLLTCKMRVFPGYYIETLGGGGIKYLATGR